MESLNIARIVHPATRSMSKALSLTKEKGEELFLQDATGGIRVKSKLAESFSPGDVIEAVGFPAVENFLPVLEDAVFRQTTEPRISLKPQPATPAELLRVCTTPVRHPARPVIDRLVKGVGQSAAESNIRTTLVLPVEQFPFYRREGDRDHSDFLGALLSSRQMPLTSSDAANGQGGQKIAMVGGLLLGGKKEIARLETKVVRIFDSAALWPTPFTKRSNEPALQGDEPGVVQTPKQFAGCGRLRFKLIRGSVSGGRPRPPGLAEIFPRRENDSFNDITRGERFGQFAFDPLCHRWHPCRNSSSPFLVSDKAFDMDLVAVGERFSRY